MIWTLPSGVEQQRERNQRPKPGRGRDEMRNVGGEMNQTRYAGAGARVSGKPQCSDEAGGSKRPPTAAPRSAART